MITAAILVLAQITSGGNPPAQSVRRVTFATLGAPIAGNVRYCTDCTAAIPCGSGGSGAFAFREGATWKCSAAAGGTLGSSVSTSEIDDDAVTYAKLQNVSASDRVIGRVSASAGDAEEITFTDQAQQLSDDTSFADMRATLGLATAAYTDVANTFTANQTVAWTTLNGDAAVIVFNGDAANVLSRAAITLGSSSGGATLAANGDAYSATRWGVALADWVELSSIGAASGLAIGTIGADPLRIGTNSTVATIYDTSQRALFGTLTPSTTSGSKLQVQAGTSTLQSSVGGELFYSVTEVGNVGTGEDALIPAFTIPANALAANGDSLRLRAYGTTANNANVKRIRVALDEGANLNDIYDAGASAIITNSDWVLECEITRESATVFKSGCNISTTGVSGLAYADVSTGTYTFANAGTIAVTGEATTNNDIVMEGWKGLWSPAP